MERTFYPLKKTHSSKFFSKLGSYRQCFYSLRKTRVIGKAFFQQGKKPDKAGSYEPDKAGEAIFVPEGNPVELGSYGQLLLLP
jgi:hypothetical protein